jgi:hypothetical protein
VAKRDVWVRVGNELVRGDNIVSITVDGGRYYQTYKLLIKVTGHRDPLVIDSGIVVGGDGTDTDECQVQASALADSFVNTLARAAALPTGVLIRLGEGADEEGRASSDWVMTALG